MDYVRVQLRITEDLLDKLDKMAEERGLTRSAMIRLLIATASNGGGRLRLPPIGDQ